MLLIGVRIARTGANPEIVLLLLASSRLSRAQKE